MEDFKIDEVHKLLTHHITYIKKYIILFVIFLFFSLYCQNSFSDSISVTPSSLTIDTQSSGTATVEILTDFGNPLTNIPVIAWCNNVTVGTVTPIIGLTDFKGQIPFTITGISNGTTTVNFLSSSLSTSLPITVISNIAPCAIASSSGGGVDEFGPETMNDELEKEDCNYHWVRTQNEFGQKKRSWIRLDWEKDVTITRMIIQTTDCSDSCGEDSNDFDYIDPGRNVGNGVVQYLDADETTWITDGEFNEEIGNVEYLFTKPITTKSIRIKKISPSTQCKGQQSNPVVFEWKVYGTPFCK